MQSKLLMIACERQEPRQPGEEVVRREAKISNGFVPQVGVKAHLFLFSSLNLRVSILDNFGLKHKTLPPDTFSQYSVIMAESGKVLDSLNERLCPTLPFKKFLKEFLKKDNPFRISVTQQEQDSIDAANSIRTEFLSHHVKMVRKFAKKYAHNHFDFDKLEDLRSEIMLAMIYASYCYII
mgnify:CR=1 FL=1